VTKPDVHALMVIRIKNIESHVGVYLGEGLFLHTTKTTGSVIDRISRWSKMIEGYYIYDSL